MGFFGDLFKKAEPTNVTVKGSGETFVVQPGQNLMKAAIAAKIAWPHSCKVGSCGSCRTTIVSGNGYYPSSPCDPTTLLTPEETASGMVIACQWYPKGGDMEVDVAIGTEGDCRGQI